MAAQRVPNRGKHNPFPSSSSPTPCDQPGPPSQPGQVAHLASLVNRGLVEADVALEKSQSPNELKQKFRDAGIAFTEI